MNISQMMNKVNELLEELDIKNIHEPSSISVISNGDRFEMKDCESNTPHQLKYYQ